MKKIVLCAAVIAASVCGNSSYAQILDEKNVVVTMDLQPVLQLKMEGPDQVDFTFNEIAQYYSGITKLGANVLKVSSSVTFDLWAVGLSQVNDNLWDNVLVYGGGNGGGGITEVPITALELHQFPANPAVTGGLACGAAARVFSAADDYSTAFQPIDYSIATPGPAAGTGANCIYTTANTTPYIAPPLAAVTAEEKYISGSAEDALTTVGCGTAGGSYLNETFASATGTITDAGYYFVMDYRIVPGLPVVFPMHQPANNSNSTAVSLTTADGLAGGGTLGDAGDAQYVSPGVYSMYIKYILAEDQ
ncbi:hypothetical protein N9R81_01510 [Flavobacteriales bacterium]|nr:hypothetical protein [Flavobacteriales bacterium]